jgi:LPS O-antigen subunit length determinant protein (WzzB/FepE family)
MNQNSPGQLEPQDLISDSEITLLDILVFLRQSYKLILLVGLIGIMASIGYLLITPKKYQASAQIQMAQIGNANKNNNNNINFLGINIEEPALLIARLSYPTSFTAEVTKGCGLGSEKDTQATLLKSVKLTLPKGVANVVDLRIIGTSPETTAICAQLVFNFIKASQALIIKPYIEEAKAKLLDNQERLEKSKDLLVKADKAGMAMGAAYLSTRDEIRFLLDEITALKNVISMNDDRATRLVTPIYASDDPITPKKHYILLVGLFGGLFLGLLIAFGRKLIEKIKRQLDSSIQLR